MHYLCNECMLTHHTCLSFNKVSVAAAVEPQGSPTFGRPKEGIYLPIWQVLHFKLL